MVKDLLSFSDCGLYFAFCGADGKLKLWDTVNGVLKQEYVPNLHLNTACSSLVWISTSSSQSSPLQSKKRKIDEGTNKILALGTSEGSLALYSLSEGKVICTLNDNSAYPVSGLCWAKVGLFCATGREVTLWDISTKKVKSKWKVGKSKITALSVSDDGKYIITASNTLSLWKIDSNEIVLIRTYMGHGSDVTNVKFVNNLYFLSCASGDRHISAWSTKTESDEPLGRFVLGEVLQGEISIFENNGVIHLSAATKDGALHFYKHQLNGKVGKIIKPHESIEIASEGSNANIIPIISTKMTSDSSAHIAYGYPPLLAFEVVAFNESGKKRTCLVRSAKYLNKPQVNNKIIHSSDAQAEFIGNGVRRKGSGDVVMEERLGNLSLGTPIISDKHSPHNLSNLLTQGLESKDKSLLESVLFQTNPNVINETVSKLPVSALPPLIAQLSHMIQGKTFSSVRGCMWLKGVLRQHSGQLLASSATSSVFASIQSQIEGRLAVLGPLRSLSGRLEHIVSQFEMPQDQPSNNDQSVLVYQDDESGDDIESLMIDGEGSDSEEKWDEQTDDPLDTETS